MRMKQQTADHVRRSDHGDPDNRRRCTYILGVRNFQLGYVYVGILTFWRSSWPGVSIRGKFLCTEAARHEGQGRTRHVNEDSIFKGAGVGLLYSTYRGSKMEDTYAVAYRSVPNLI